MADSTKDLYNFSTVGKEISLRDELEATFDGTVLEIDKAQDGLLRRMRRDSNNKLIVCDCVHKDTGEPLKDRFCPTCLGEGYLWDEVAVDFYKVLKTPREVLFEAGLTNVELMIFYLRYNTTITRQDKIIRLVLDADGQAAQPIRRQNVYRIHAIDTLRLDSGRIEYLKVTTFREDVRYLNGDLGQ